MSPPDRVKRPADPANWSLRPSQAPDLATIWLPFRPAPLPDRASKGQYPPMRGQPKPPKGAALVELRFCRVAEARSSPQRERPPAWLRAPRSRPPIRDHADEPRYHRRGLAEAAVRPARPSAEDWRGPSPRRQTGPGAPRSKAPPILSFLQKAKELPRTGSRATPVADALPSGNSPGRPGCLQLPKRPLAGFATSLESAGGMRPAPAILPRAREPTCARARVGPGLPGSSRLVVSKLSARSAVGRPAPMRPRASPPPRLSCPTPRAGQRLSARQDDQMR